MIYPDFLKNDGEIFFAAPSFGAASEPYKTAFLHAMEVFRKKGMRTVSGENCFLSDGCGISSTPQKCAGEIMQAFAGSAQTVISCGGGELMCEILPYVDFDELKKHPKWFMGYSDNTNLTFLLNTICDMASIYGPCAPAFGMEPWHSSINDAWELLTGKKLRMRGYDGWENESKKDEDHPLESYNITQQTRYVIYDGGKAKEEVKLSGRLLGGCLDCLENLAGTSLDMVKSFNKKYGGEGILWFIESCDLNNFGMRRALWHLKMCGWFENASGFLIGRPAVYGQDLFGLNQYDAVTETLKEFGVPVVMDLDFGHLKPQMPILSGAMAKTVVRKNLWEVEFYLK